jgi:PIN domain nuclease of toxin-antitoxin system
MKLLLDSHVFLWLMESPGKVSPAALSACEDAENSLFLSVVSIWEMQIKLGNGKLTLKKQLQDIVEDQQRSNRLEMLAVRMPHLWALPGLPVLHGDPFDRMLVAQAGVEDMFLVTADRTLANYPVKVLW